MGRVVLMVAGAVARARLVSRRLAPSGGLRARLRSVSRRSWRMRSGRSSAPLRRRRGIRGRRRGRRRSVRRRRRRRLRVRLRRQSSVRRASGSERVLLSAVRRSGRRRAIGGCARVRWLMVLPRRRMLCCRTLMLTTLLRRLLVRLRLLARLLTMVAWLRQSVRSLVVVAWLGRLLLGHSPTERGRHRGQLGRRTGAWVRRALRRLAMLQAGLPRRTRWLAMRRRHRRLRRWAVAVLAVLAVLVVAVVGALAAMRMVAVRRVMVMLTRTTRWRRCVRLCRRAWSLLLAHRRRSSARVRLCGVRRS